MDAVKDLKWVIGIFFGLFVIWYITGGPDRSISHEGKYIKPLAPLNTGEGYGGGYISPYFNSSDGGLSRPSDATLPDNSPLAGKVTITSRGGAGEVNSDKEYIVIKAKSTNNDGVLLSGFTLGSAVSGKHTLIGKGVYLPYGGKVNQDEPIILFPGDEAIITTGHSPIGASFKENTCTGYLEQYQEFTPRLTAECPLPSDDSFYKQQSWGSVCRSFVNSIKQCQTSTTLVPAGAEKECKDFIAEKVNYNGCIADNKNEADFYKPRWRVYIGFDTELWRDSREAIVLLDGNGKLVSSLTY